MNGMQISLLVDTERIAALPDRAAREAALLALEPNRRNMVSHFLVLRFAKALCESLPGGARDQVIAEIPEALVADVLPLARSYVKAARLVAAGK